MSRVRKRVDTDEGRAALGRGLAETAMVDPLDALRDVAELVSLLSGWQWQAMYAARLAGSSWEQIGAAFNVTGHEARTQFAVDLDRQERIRPGSITAYRLIV